MIIFIYMKIQTVSEIGILIKQERKQQGILQQDLAELSGVSMHFLSNLENGKETVEFKKVLQVFRSLGISVWLEPPSERQ
jgi:HTH-type transcriptional regulator / antitoxin HipB